MSDAPRSDEPEEEHDAEVDEPRSIFSALWVRAALAIAVLGTIGAVAMPYVLDWTRPAPPPAKPAPAATARVTQAPATPQTPAALPPTMPLTASASSSATTPPPAAPAPVVSVVAETKPAPKVAPAPPPVSATSPEKSAPSAPPSSRTSVTSPADQPASADKVARAEKSSAPDKTVIAETKPARAPSAVTKTPAPARNRGRETAAKATTPGGARAGSYWVQVGAYKDERTAGRVAARLREQGYHVEEVAPTAAPSAAPGPAPTPAAPPSPASDKYEVFVSGASTTSLSERLGAKGLAAEPTASGLMVKPALPLRDAIALSKDLAIDGLKVQVRREGVRPAAAAKPAPPSPASGMDGLHRVRVGAFPDRVAALAAVRELGEKGYEGFVVRRTP